VFIDAEFLDWLQLENSETVSPGYSHFSLGGRAIPVYSVFSLQMMIILGVVIAVIIIIIVGE